MITRKAKENVVSQISNKISNSSMCALVSYEKLKVPALEEYRRELYQSETRMQTIKKSLIKIALQNTQMSNENFSEFKGNVALVYGNDVFSSLKNLFKKHINILAGMINGSRTNIATMKKLSTMESVSDLYGQIVFLMLSPIRAIMSCLKMVIYKILLIIKEVKNV